MPLDLTNLDRGILQRSPLASVICQIRYEVTPAASDPRLASEFFERLKSDGRFERLDQVIESALNVSLGAGLPPAVAQQPANSGWRLTAPDGQRSVALMPTHIAVEATAYDGWEADFAPLLAEVVQAVAEMVQPVFEQRIGLRYINQMTEPEIRTPQDWRGLIADSFLPLITSDELGSMVAFVRQQATLQLDEEARCIINSGFAPDPDRDGALTFLLDFDIAREGMRRFDVAQVLATADRFNEYALRLFQLATTEDLRGVLANA